MKVNEIKIVTIILVSVIVIMLVNYLVFTIIGRNKGFKIKLFSCGGNTQLLFEEEYAITEIKKIKVMASSENIKVIQGKENQVKVSIYGEEEEAPKVKLENGNLTIEKENTLVHLMAFFYFIKKEIIIEVPPHYKDEIEVKASSGNINIEDLEYANMQLTASSGNIKMGNANQVKAKTSSGRIQVEVIKQEANLQASSGNIQVAKAEKIEAKTSSGKIEIGEIGEGNLRTTSGSIKIAKAQTGEAKTSSGKIQIGEIKEAILNTTSGKIQIEKGDSITATTSSGTIDIGSIEKYCNFNTTSGSIKIQNLQLSENSKIQTTSGSVKISNAKQIYIEAYSTSGSVKIEESNRKADIELKIKTTSGSISVNH